MRTVREKRRNRSRRRSAGSSERVNAPPKNDLLLRALRREPVPRTPVWIMRQAGRYLPEYREMREQAGDFMSLCRNPELACEVTLQPLRRYALDAAILFSDILTIPDAMGLGLYFSAGEGPCFHNPVRNSAAIRRLAVPDVDHELRYVFDAVSRIRRELGGRVPLIGFAGSPWTVATYMVEGRSSREFGRIRALLAEDPGALSRLLDTVARTTVEYLNGQIESGAQAIMIFDTWGGVLERDDYLRFSLESMQQILASLVRQRDGEVVPVILFTKGAGDLLTDMAGSGCDALGVDWMTSLADARELTSDRVALQGNLEPAKLKGSPSTIAEGVAEVLASYGKGPGHVFNLGHGITPDIEPENVAVMVEAVHRLSPQYHAP